MIYDYNYIRDKVLIGRCKNKARIASHTRILRDGDNFVMDWGSGKRWSNPIMTFFPNGDKRIDYKYTPGSGTINRFRYGGVRMFQKRVFVGVLHGGLTLMYQSGLILHPDGTASNITDHRNFSDTVRDHIRDINRRARWKVGGESGWCKVGDIVTRKARNQHYVKQETDDAWLVKRFLFNDNGNTKVDLVSVKTGERHDISRWGFKYAPDVFLTASYGSRSLTSTGESGTSEV